VRHPSIDSENLTNNRPLETGQDRR